jgi:hypothetical protein
MKVSQINNFIRTNLFSNGKIVSKRCRKEWFEKQDKVELYNNIYRKTEFLSDKASFIQRVWHIYNEVFEIPLCQYDNITPTNFKSFKDGYYKYASTSASNKSTITINKRIENNLQKWGVEHFTQTEEFKYKASETWKSNYGVDNPSKSVEIKNKKIKTTLDNYGVKWPQQSKEVRSKSIKTNLEKYGVENPMQNIDIQSKVSNTRLSIEFERFFTNTLFYERMTPLFTVNEYNGIDVSYPFLCKRCNLKFNDVIRGGKIPRCYNCYPNSNISVAETELGDYIESLGIDIIRNDKSILNGKEIDIIIPQLNIGIEYNGIYFHSELNGGKSKKYHLNKTNECKKAGIRLIHIFEDEWLNNTHIVKSKLKHILNKSDSKIFARKCNIQIIDNKLANNFLEKTHIQGKVNSSVQIGLFHLDKLVGVMTFSKRKIFGNTEWELVRFSTSTHIVGGFTKLLKWFEINYNPKTIITYALNHWVDTDTNVYLKNGFKSIGKSFPSYHYLKNGIRYNRINFQKHKLKDKLEKFDPNLTEWENMQLNGYDRIWDCGSTKYSKVY